MWRPCGNARSQARGGWETGCDGEPGGLGVEGMEQGGWQDPRGLGFLSEAGTISTF